MKLGRGRRLSEVLGEMHMVAEGVKTAESAWALAKRNGIDMPITEQVYKVLHEDKPARSAVVELMTRNLKAEGI
jgi:glycerol-3-phosphate dehydrogenase (NAD(P)+)